MTGLLLSVTIVFALAGLVTAILYRASAALRHMVWACAFGAVLLLAPLRWRIPQKAIASPLPSITVSAVSAPTTSTPSQSNPLFNPTTVLLSLWGLGALAMLTRLLRHAIRLRSIIGRSRGRRPVLISHQIRGPLAGGLFRQVILLPENSASWDAARRRAVFAHEAAHLRRSDPRMLLVAHVVAAIYWFHPLCWFALARLRAESERACDDAALRSGQLPSGYAGHLLELAGKIDFPLAIPMATTSHLESRVKHILDPKTNRSLPARATWAAAFILTAGILIPLSSFSLKAQATGGSATISGIVSDPTGARVPRVKVVATNSDLGYEETTLAKADGRYTFMGMPAGHYSIEVVAPGFAKYRTNDLALVSGASLQVDARLTIGGISESIIVSAPGKPRATVAAITPTTQARPLRIGGNVQAAAVLHRVNPVYPSDLQAQGIEGIVLMRAIISKEGVPQMLTIVKPGVAALDAAAIDAVRQWRFRPTLLNGEPVEVTTTIDVSFTLNQ